MTEKREFYVYKYVDRLKKVPFYIGKGKNYRKDQHMSNAKKGLESTLYDRIRLLGFEDGVDVIVINSRIYEDEAIRLEVDLIDQIGRSDIGNGPLLNKSSGGEGISGGIDMYGYRRIGIARKITDIVDKGMLISDMPAEVRSYIKENGMKVEWDENRRIIPHIQEMGNVGSHYKGPKIKLKGWQFSLNREMIDVNRLTLETNGFLKVHGDLPWNNGHVTPVPDGYDFGY